MGSVLIVKKILIIDDDKAFCFYVRAGLEMTGKYNVDILTKPKDAMKAIKRNRPELILLDAMMPKMSGFDVLKALKKDLDTMGIPVVMLTSLDTDDGKTKALRLGNEGYLVKPTTVEAMEAIIDRNLSVRAPQEVTQAPKVEQGQERKPSSNKKVLVVDDEKATCELVEAFLSSAGFQVQTLQSAENALALIKNKKIDIVILDLVMPGVDGMELLSDIKEEIPKTKVIVLTGVNDPEVIKDVIALKADDIIIKPFSMNQLSVTMARHTSTGNDKG